MKSDALAAEDFDVESSSIPDADSEDKQEESTAPEWGIVKEENCGQFCQNGIDWGNHMMSILGPERDKKVIKNLRNCPPMKDSSRY